MVIKSLEVAGLMAALADWLTVQAGGVAIRRGIQMSPTYLVSIGRQTEYIYFTTSACAA